MLTKLSSLIAGSTKTLVLFRSAGRPAGQVHHEKKNRPSGKSVPLDGKFIWADSRGALVALTVIGVLTSNLNVARGALPTPRFEKEDEVVGPMLVLDIGGHLSKVRRVLFTPDGKRLISVGEDKTIRVWDLNNGEQLQRLLPPAGAGNAGKMFAAALSPDGQTLAVGGHGLQNNPIYLIRLDTFQTKSLPGHHAAVRALAFSPDGNILASGSDDKTVILWKIGEAAASASTLKGHEASVDDLCFSPDGHWIATASEDQTARLWSVTTGTAGPVMRLFHEKSRLGLDRA